MKIPHRAYDSHVHLLATGMVEKGLTLFHLKNLSDLESLSQHPHYNESFRGEFLVGFGWDQNQFRYSEAENKILEKSKSPNYPDFPSAALLDLYFPEIPVCLVRADGHVNWLNSVSLKKLGWFESLRPDPMGGVILRDTKGFPTGIFFDLAKIEIDMQIPQLTPAQTQDYLISAFEIFQKAGFSHVRDMTGNWAQWRLLKQLENQGRLPLVIQQNFSIDVPKDLPEMIQNFLAEKSSEQLIMGGIKIFFDGALGSQGAWISQPYAGTRDHFGQTQFSVEQMHSMMSQIFSAGIPVCVHTIGDQAAHQIMLMYLQLKSQNIPGKLHLEHVQLLRPETIELMKGQNVVCHLQPSHFLTDQSWLREKIPLLMPYLFQWRALEDAGIPFYFGSDSPIEKPSLPNNQKALIEAESWGIKNIKRPFLNYQQFKE